MKIVIIPYMAGIKRTKVWEDMALYEKKKKELNSFL
jgi:hypothetical protein